MRTIHSTEETVDEAKRQTKYTLRELVGSEVDDWSDERLRREAHESADIMVAEASYGHPEIYGLIADRARTMWLGDMSRVDTDLIRSDLSDKELVLQHGFWPNDMRKCQVREIVESVDETEIPSDCWAEAVTEVKRGIVRKLIGDETGN